ncbi:MFS general substrate transporter [Lophium mytilinum]|uniref:MFS general substrate transporter n=1 Tax=Lophium mytilinum TaxID=390894 RepID=A0A6A6R8A4_9PEZI|nr:MFS general substrate transporter [Lophium mytilinum]
MLYDDPFGFPVWKKWMITVLLANLTLTATFNSSVFSSSISVTAIEFHTNETITLLGVSLYVIGFALGPLLWGPLSEVLGRKPPLFIGFVLFSIMQIPTALANNLPAILICRWLAGCFSAAPLVIVSAAYADFWGPSERGTATAVYGASAFAGPTFGPIIGSFITESSLGWRWTAWITLIMAGLFGIPAFLLVPETYAPVLREKAAKKLQKRHIEAGTVELGSDLKKKPFDGFIRKFLSKPVKMLVTEPMLLVMTIYISIVYATMYLTFFAIPYTFISVRGWSRSISSLPFLSLLVGILTGCLALSIYSKKYYLPRFLARKSVLPEDRLPPIMLGSIFLPAGLFWLAWTSDEAVSWVPQVISLFFVGAGIQLIFSNGIVFIIDIYLSSSASALAANTCIRSAVAAGLPLAAPRMYKTLGVKWATSLIGFLCLACMPAPFLFYKYGEKLRRRSKFAPTK